MGSFFFLVIIGILYKYSEVDKGILFYFVMFWLLAKSCINLGTIGIIVFIIIIKVIKDIIFGVSHP
jgi:hypothetical protein